MEAGLRKICALFGKNMPAIQQSWWLGRKPQNMSELLLHTLFLQTLIAPGYLGYSAAKGTGVAKVLFSCSLPLHFLALVLIVNYSWMKNWTNSLWVAAGVVLGELILGFLAGSAGGESKTQ